MLTGLHAFAEACFLRPVRCPQALGCPLNAIGRLAQAATLLEITTRLVDDIGHGFTYVAMFFDSLSAMGSPCGPLHLEECRA